MEFKKDFLFDWGDEAKAKSLLSSAGLLGEYWVPTKPVSSLGAKIALMDPGKHDTVLHEVVTEVIPYSANRNLVGFGKSFVISGVEVSNQENPLQYLINRMEDLFGADLKKLGSFNIATGHISMAQVVYYLSWSSMTGNFRCRVVKEGVSVPKSVAEQVIVEAKAEHEKVLAAIETLEQELKKPNCSSIKKLAATSALKNWKQKLKKLEAQMKTFDLPQPSPPAPDFFVVGFKQGMGSPTPLHAKMVLPEEYFAPFMPANPAAVGPSTKSIVDMELSALLVQLQFVGPPANPKPEALTLDALFELQKYTLHLLKKGLPAEELAKWVTEHSPGCCPYARVDDCLSYGTVNAYFDDMRQAHFVLMHGASNGKTISAEDVIGLLSECWTKVKNGVYNAMDAVAKVNDCLPIGAPRPSPDVFTSSDSINQYGTMLQEWVHWETHEPEEIVELTICGLTAKEAAEVLKNYGKSKSTGKSVMVHKTTRKELGTKSKAIVVWPFESSSMQVNGEPILYKTQLNEDGTTSCNCQGWCVGSAKNPSGRFCKHTTAIKAEAELLYKEWKKSGTIKGENFEVVSADKVSTASSKTLYKALKEQPAEGEATMFKAKRIVEI
jgi:uncharacterized protein YqcC (DUF446 family)